MKKIDTDFFKLHGWWIIENIMIWMIGFSIIWVIKSITEYTLFKECRGFGWDIHQKKKTRKKASKEAALLTIKYPLLLSIIVGIVFNHSGHFLDALLIALLITTISWIGSIQETLNKLIKEAKEDSL